MRTVHYWATALLLLAAVPLLKHLNLPTRLDWFGLAFTYWVLLATKAIFVAVIFYLIGFSSAETIQEHLGLLRRNKVRIPLLLGYFGILVWVLGWAKASVVTVDTAAILELRERLNPHGLRRLASTVLPVALYLFVGLLLVSAYNDIILSVRFFGADDGLFNSMDKWLLHGLTVPELCHWALRAFPISAFHLLEFVYYGMFAQIGAALILICHYCGRRRGLQFVGAILTGYYIALVLFYLWPSQGPYYLCPVHFTQFPHELITYAAQKGSIAGAQARWSHERLSRISFDYYIAFPCMHIVQPLIVMWFLRFSRRMLVALSAYNVLLVAGIVLLEWHYVVDVLAGVLVAVLAVAMVEGRQGWNRRSTAKGATMEMLHGAALP